VELFWQQFLVIATAHAVAVMGPGPDFAIVTKYALKYGKRIGVATAAGVGLAIMLHVSYALLGFTLIISKSPVLYSIVKYAGAAYLLYLAYQSFKSKPNKKVEISDKAIVLDTIKAKHAFFTGFLTNVLNVKAMLFFLTLFTAAVSTSTPASQQLIYGIWMSLATFAWFAFVANVFGNQRVKNAFMKKAHIIDYVMGLIFVGFAVYLVFGK